MSMESISPSRMRLGQDWNLAEGRREAIQPGMRVEAEIKTGERRVIEYLLSPVMQAAQEAGREVRGGPRGQPPPGGGAARPKG